jgi:hypothetical protein
MVDLSDFDVVLDPPREIIVEPNPKNIPPSFTNSALWSIPARIFGNARFLRSSLGNDNSLNTSRIVRSYRDWKIAAIAVNPNTQSLIAATPNLTPEQRRNFIKRTFPNSVLYNDDNIITFDEIQLNPFLATTIANATSLEWQSVMNFWAYPNGEFLPVRAVTNFGAYINFWPYPPQLGNPQFPGKFIGLGNSRYELIKNEGQSFQITVTPTTIVYGGRSNNNNNFISKTFTVPDWYPCTQETFGNPFPSNGSGSVNNVAACYRFLGGPFSNVTDDILALYPLPPETRQSATKPIVRYVSTQENRSNGIDKNWIYLRYYRERYNASPMQCAITRTKVQQIDNRDYITLENGYRFTSRTYLDLEVDPAILQTNVQETPEQIDMKIEVTCNPVYIGNNRVATNDTYVNTMINYCGGGNPSVYQDSYFLSGANTNLSRTDPEGNALGYGTLQRWDSEICKNFTLTSLQRSAVNFNFWCSDIANWTENGGCFNMANAVTPETQNAVNPTLINLCKDEVLDERPCLKYCFASNTDNLDCSVNLGLYCKRLVSDSLRESYPTGTYTNSTNSVTTQLPIIIPSPDGYDVTLSASSINFISNNVIRNHRQCACFMPLESFQAYYQRITEDFPPTPELNAFILHFYTQPSCSFPNCVHGGYQPRGQRIPVLRDVESLTFFQCPKDYNLRTTILEKGPNVLEKTWLRECIPVDKKKNNLSRLPTCPVNFNLHPTCRVADRSILCTSRELQCTRTVQYLGDQCPNVIFCIQNAVFSVSATGVKAEVNIEGEISISQNCTLSLSRFNQYIDTKLVSPITSTLSLYQKCYLDSSNVINLPTFRATNVGGPAIPAPLFECRGYFAFNADNQMELIVVSLKSGILPSPVQDPSNPTLPLAIYRNNNLVAKYINFETRITAIGPTTGGTQQNLHTYLVSNQNINLGSETSPIDIYLENVAPTFDPVPPEYVQKGTNAIVEYYAMDFVHIYETNAWLNMKNTTPTRFSGRLLKSSTTGNQNLIEITAGSVRGPLGPGLLSQVNGIKRDTYLVERVTESPLRWSYESSEMYDEDVGFVQMYVNVTSVQRYATGYITQVNADSLNIALLETNEDLNQNQWSFSNTDLRTLNANGQLSSHWTIVKDPDGQIFPNGKKVDQNSWNEYVNPNASLPSTDTNRSQNIVDQEFFPNDKNTTSSSSVLIVVITVILLIVAIIVTFVILARKKKIGKKKL